MAYCSSIYDTVFYQHLQHKWLCILYFVFCDLIPMAIVCTQWCVQEKHNKKKNSEINKYKIICIFTCLETCCMCTQKQQKWKKKRNSDNMRVMEDNQDAKQLIKWCLNCQSATQIKYSCYNILQQQYLIC